MPTLVCIHLGLGDFINYTPLLKELSLKDELFVPCYEKYIPNVKQFISGLPINLIPIPDNEGSIIPVIIEGYKLRKDFKIIGLGHYAKETFDVRHHIIDGYKKLGYDFRDLCLNGLIMDQAKKVIQMRLPSYPYAFIPEGGSTGKFKIDRKYAMKGWVERIEITPPQVSLMLSYADIILHAEEIHCHDTSWLWLVNQIPTTGKLFFHKYVRDDGMDYKEMFIKDWTIIE